MNSDYSIPPIRDLPPGRLAELRQHLLAEIECKPEGRLFRPTRWRPVYALVAAIIVLAAIAGPTLALSSSAREFIGLSSSPRPVFTKARLKVSAPAPHGQVLRLYTAPSTGGGECWFIGVSPATSAAKPNDRRGAGCALSGGSLHSTKLPFQVGMGQVRRPNGPGFSTWIPADVSGWVSPALHAARVELVWRRGHQRLSFANDYFLGATAIVYSPPFADLPFYLVAYNASGHEVARQKLDNASLYIDWKRDGVRDRLRSYWKVHGHP
jgi:hypothetical protein